MTAEEIMFHNFYVCFIGKGWPIFAFYIYFKGPIVAMLVLRAWPPQRRQLQDQDASNPIGKTAQINSQ